MAVTRQLGLQYLWVDRYCINQENSDEMTRQISQMDRVYRGAEITIIAAAGDDDSFGLPGVGGTPRQPQMTVSLEAATLVYRMSHPHVTIAASTWVTRAWTYQEALLSRRRLCFTSEQVYLECESAFFYESMMFDRVQLEMLKKKRQSYKDKIRYNLMFGLFNDHHWSLDREDIRRVLTEYSLLVEKYTRRKMKLDEDSFRAFAGIAKLFEESRPPILSLCGLPIPHPQHPAKYGMFSMSYCELFVLGLMWAHVADHQDPLRAPRRRTDFPSWSWTGWAGDARLGYIIPERYQITTTLCRIDLELRNGKLISLNKCRNWIENGCFVTEEPTILYFDAEVYHPQASRHGDVVGISDADFWKEQWAFCTTAHFQGLRVQMRISRPPCASANSRTAFVDGEWALLLLGESHYSHLFLVIEFQSPGTSATRVGCLDANGLVWDKLKPSMVKRRIRLV